MDIETSKDERWKWLGGLIYDRTKNKRRTSMRNLAAGSDVSAQTIRQMRDHGTPLMSSEKRRRLEEALHLPFRFIDEVEAGAQVEILEQLIQKHDAYEAAMDRRPPKRVAPAQDLSLFRETIVYEPSTPREAPDQGSDPEGDEPEQSQPQPELANDEMIRLLTRRLESMRETMDTQSQMLELLSQRVTRLDRRVGEIEDPPALWGR